MLVLARRIEHAFDVTVQGSHDADPREHCRPVMFDDQQERPASRPETSNELILRGMDQHERSRHGRGDGRMSARLNAAGMTRRAGYDITEIGACERILPTAIVGAIRPARRW
jgi:hypothetical protein